MNELAESSRHTKLQLALWLPLARVFAKFMLFVLGPVRIRGSYRVPKTGPVLVLANHVSDIDPIIVQSACHRALHFMAKSELFEIPIVGRLQRAFGSFAVVRGTPDRAALKQAASLLHDEGAVAIFPEGQISEDGNLQEIKAGVAIIIRMCPGVPVICCGIQGAQRIIPYGSVFPRPALHRVDVTWGEARTFEKTTTTEEILGWISGQLLELSTPS